MERVKLNYALNSLQPSIGENTMNFHYNKLYKGYVDKFNKGEGDPVFNEAGAYLHGLYFEQLTPNQDSDEPTGAVGDLITEFYDTYEDFKKKFEAIAMKVQGSAWVYLAGDGSIKVIPNHAKADDIIILIDWWEHAYYLTYPADKQSYLENHWEILDWDVINMRLK